MFSPEQNIECFKQTRELSHNDYISKETQKTINNTKIYHEPTRCIVPETKSNSKVEFIIADTVSAIFNIGNKTKDKIAVLNFADPFTPGGMVEYGSQTQEECLCRCSNLYESLIKNECIEEYYKYNQSLGNMLFSDRIIYSPDVAFFRDNITYNTTGLYVKCDIITSPAPKGVVKSIIGKDEYYKALVNRITGILKVAASNDCKIIILGAWGCGAFRNPPDTVATAFKQAISEVKAFNYIVFAMYKDDETSNIFKHIILK